MKEQKMYFERLKLVMFLRDISYSDLAEKLDLSKQSISKYIKGTARPRHVVVMGIIEILELPLDFFTRDQIVIKIDKDEICVN